MKKKLCRPLLNKVAAILSFLCLISLGGALSAANISTQKKDDSECAFSLQGEIKAGDAEQLSKLIESSREVLIAWEPSYICLDSPGGSLMEGVELAKVISGAGLCKRNQRITLRFYPLIFHALMLKFNSNE